MLGNFNEEAQFILLKAKEEMLELYKFLEEGENNANR